MTYDDEPGDQIERRCGVLPLLPSKRLIAESILMCGFGTPVFSHFCPEAFGRGKRIVESGGAQSVPAPGTAESACVRTVPPAGHWGCLRLPRARGVPLGMSRIHPECPDSDPSDRSVAADVLLRQEPAEEEDEEEDDGKEDDDDHDTNDDGYSE